jgi:hypothetical protein
MKLKVSLGILAITSSALFAEYALAACSTVACTGKISTLLLTSSGEVRVKLDQPMSTMNCTLLSGEYAVLKAEHANRDEIYALLLAAHMTGTDGVQVRIVENSPDCEITYVRSTN